MTQKDQIKLKALETLDEYIKGELRYLEDNNLKLENFSLENMLEDALSEEEKLELSQNIEHIKNSVSSYCKCRGIVINAKLL